MTTKSQRIIKVILSMSDCCDISLYYVDFTKGRIIYTTDI